MKKYLIILSVVIPIICIGMFINIPNTEYRKINKNVYSIVFYNNTYNEIDYIEIYMEDIGGTKFLYTHESNILPCEYRKINIDIQDSRLNQLKGSRNVYLKCVNNNQIIDTVSAGYFTTEYGGLEFVILRQQNDKMYLESKNSDSDKEYLRIKNRHIKNESELSWFE